MVHIREAGGGRGEIFVQKSGVGWMDFPQPARRKTSPLIGPRIGRLLGSRAVQSDCLGPAAIRETAVVVVPQSALAAVVVELVGFRGQLLEPLALPVALRQQPTPTELPTGMFFPNSD